MGKFSFPHSEALEKNSQEVLEIYFRDLKIKKILELLRILWQNGKSARIIINAKQ